jgi:hypothetical protein
LSAVKLIGYRNEYQDSAPTSYQIFLFAFRLPLGPTYSPTQLVSAAVSPGNKVGRSVHLATHVYLLQEVKNI